MFVLMVWIFRIYLFCESYCIFNDLDVLNYREINIYVIEKVSYMLKFFFW